MKLSLIRKIAIALAVALAVVLAVVFADWREVLNIFGFIGIVATIAIPIYLYFNRQVASKESEERDDKMRDCVRMLKDLKQELPEYGNAIDFVIDEVQKIAFGEGIAQTYLGKEIALREKWVKLAKHPKLREKWLGEEWKEWIK